MPPIDSSATKGKNIDLSAADVNDLFKGDVEYAAVVLRGK
jgi:hypothetical protein